MPLTGKQWRHITFGTHNSWLPGDPRGFRDHNHRLHSSGDHRLVPPAGEYAKLNQYAKQISSTPLLINKPNQWVVLHAIKTKLEPLDHRHIAIACCGMHVHILVE
ncbi:MAG: hypothetical protein JKX85_05485 [Phycisphaeraceae bacterium]|nr:hypothetical protein [Phycisphaeraceae bacterium]